MYEECKDRENCSLMLFLHVDTVIFFIQYGPSNQRQLKEACLVVDVLDSKVKKDLLAWFVKLQLAEYLVLFGEKEEVSAHSILNSV